VQLHCVGMNEAHSKQQRSCKQQQRKKPCPKGRRESGESSKEQRKSANHQVSVKGAV
jgi:hypothetical protein